MHERRQSASEASYTPFTPTHGCCWSRRMLYPPRSAARFWKWLHVSRMLRMLRIKSVRTGSVLSPYCLRTLYAKFRPYTIRSDPQHPCVGVKGALEALWQRVGLHACEEHNTAHLFDYRHVRLTDTLTLTATYRTRAALRSKCRHSNYS